MIHELPDGTRLRLRFITPSDKAQLAGVGRFVRDPQHREQAEVAITIGDPWQGMGLGRTIGLALADVARARGIRRFSASLLGTNVAAARLFHAISRRVQTECSGAIADLVVELDTREHPISPASLAA